MTQANDELLAFLAQPPHLPTAYAIGSWLDVDSPKRTAPVEARELLGSGVNLATAMKIRDAVVVIETQAFETFWGNVEAMLQHMLRSSNVQGWRVLRNFEQRGFISVIPDSTSVSQNQMFQVCAENLRVPAKKEPGFFGVWKGGSHEHDPALSAELKRQGFKSHDNWIGWKWFHACGMPDFTVTRENVIRLNADNHSIDKPLANEVSQVLWQLFDVCRLRLEELNRSINKVRF